MRKTGLFITVIIFSLFANAQKAKTTFEVKGDQFMLNGKPYQILSGEVHYQRIPESTWKDCFLKAKAMGLNCITTYVFWNAHEMIPGNFDFSGNLDVAKFCKTAQEVGLYVILRPGPYVCSEWDFGGLPAWLLNEKNMQIRCMNDAYMAAVKRYINRLGQELKDLQVTKGGPIIMVQVENEYGAHGSDIRYLQELAKIEREAGFDVPFFLSNPPITPFLENGTLPDAVPTLNFLENPEKGFETLKAFRPVTPRMCSEYWLQAIVHWRDKEWVNKNTKVQYDAIEWMLKNKVSISIYMFHGGTNFGFWAGANCHENFDPYITSYDNYPYLDESGRPTKEYYGIRNLMLKYKPNGEKIPDVPKSDPLIEIPEINFTQSALLMENLPQSKYDHMPRTMEEYGQYYGYILYRTKLPGNKKNWDGKNNMILYVEHMHDYAAVYMNGELRDTLDRTIKKNSMPLLMDNDKQYTLDILTEALGRSNFGVFMADRKGIENVNLSHFYVLMDWDVFNLPMTNDYLDHLKYGAKKDIEAPAFYKAEFNIDKPGDTYLDMRSWKKGFVVVNGHNLGRFWYVGPQYDLYLPGAFLKKGKNEIIVFDMFQPRNAVTKGEKVRRSNSRI